jgi:hypothetical protein
MFLRWEYGPDLSTVLSPIFYQKFRFSTKLRFKSAEQVPTSIEDSCVRCFLAPVPLSTEPNAGCDPQTAAELHPIVACICRPNPQNILGLLLTDHYDGRIPGPVAKKRRTPTR